MTDAEFLASLGHGAIAPTEFHHAGHVRMGFCLARKYGFGEACMRARAILNSIAKRAGQPQLYHETVTVAFLALINARAAAQAHVDFTPFAAANPDLLDKTALARFYDRDLLDSALARRAFILPGDDFKRERPLEHAR